jgi:tetratricopeptide (TPR) repeat protein
MNDAAAGLAVGRVPVRVFISYAHDDEVHEERVRDFWLFLRAHGIDARLDLPAAEQRVDWAQWMTQQVRNADRVLVIASPEYKRRAEDNTEPDEGRGVQWEARQIRDRIYADQQAGLQAVVPVVLPGCSADDLPGWLTPTATTHYRVGEYTVPGAERLLRLLTGQPSEIEPPLGSVPVLAPRGAEGTAAVAPTRPGLRTEVVIEAAVSDGVLVSAVWVAGSLLCQRRVPLPGEVASVWAALGLPGVVAGQRMAHAGRRLAAALLEEAGQRLLGGLVDQLAPGDSVEVMLSASGAALALPVELIRLGTDAGAEVGPLGLLPAVSVSRRPAALGQVPGAGPVPGTVVPPVGVAGPLKVLAAVAAPDETKTPNVPLDVEAEMAAVLDAVTGDPHVQVRVLEVASLAAIRQALVQDAYHVLHLSAHGSADVVELEDEDGAPVPVVPQALMEALRHAGRQVPLIVLSSCSGGSAGSQAMAAALVARGADRVVAMLAPVTDTYATTLARHFYAELSAHPELPVGLALARARYLAEEDRPQEDGDRPPVPEYGVATLLAAGGDGPLINPAVPQVALTVMTTPPGGKGVRELPMGALIGRRPQLRAAMGVLRRTPEAVRRSGVAGGVVLTGVGGIGKTALAGRVVSRLRDEGWLVAVHEGRWNPTALIDAVGQVIDQALPRAGGPAQAAVLEGARAMLTDLGGDDGPKLAAIAGLLADRPLLVVFDDFEQNLTVGGEAFLDLAVDEVITALAGAAETGALLLTCRYPLPGPERFLVPVPVPALSGAELRRLFLRLPALAGLDAAERRLLIRTIGGHPRLIEFTDALLRGGHASFKHIQLKLSALARAEGIDLDREPSLAGALDQAMLLGSADILLTELTALLSDRQVQVLRQVAVCRAPMTLADLAYTFTPHPDDPSPAAGTQPSEADLRADVDRLTGLTLLTPGEGIVMHPWTADLVTRNTGNSLDAQHERALAMRFRRLEQGRGSYGDLIDIPRHLAALHQFDDIPGIADQVTQILPGTLATVAYLAEIRPLIPPAERAWTLVTDLEVQALMDAGDLPAATQQLHAMHQQIQARAAADPTNSEWQRDLSVSHNRLGDVAVAAGDLRAARTAHQASLDIRRRLAAADPTNSGWQRDLSVSHERVGDVAVAAGDLRAARTAYQASLDTRRRLAAADPTNSGWQRDLSVSHNKLGDVAVAAGDLEAARTAYQASLDTRQRLAAADPTNSGWQRDLSVSHEKLGDVAVAAGDLEAARTAYQASLDIRQRLAAADPTNTQRQYDLGAIHDRLGQVAVAAGDLEAARTAYQASLDIAERLAAADPTNSGWQRVLSVSHNKLGDVAVAARDLEAARTAYQASLDIRQRLTAADPTNSGWQRDLSVSHERLGDVAVAARDLEAARTAHQASLDIRQRLTAADPTNSGWQRDLSVSHEKLGDVAVAAGDLEAARTAHQASLDIRQRLAAADPTNSEWQRDLSVSHNKLGDVAVAARDLEAARTAYQASLDIAERLAAADPTNTTWRRDLQTARQRMNDLPDSSQ